MKNSNENCVELNIYVECDRCSRSESKAPCDCEGRKDNDENCVKINVFVDCDKKKYSYTV